MTDQMAPTTALPLAWRHSREWPRSEDGRNEGTWLDLIPPDDPARVDPVLINRDELLDRLRAQGYEISERSLRAWEAAEILPRPIRRWQEGGSRSASRALYPEWAVDVVAMASELKAKMKGLAPSLIRFHLIWPAAEALELYIRGTRTSRVAFVLSRALMELVQRESWLESESPRAMEVRLLNADGDEVHTQTVRLPNGITIAV